MKKLKRFERIPVILQELIFEKAFSVAELAKMTPMKYEEYQESLLNYVEVKELAKTAEDDGRRKEKIEIAQKLKLMGLSTEQVQEATGLSGEDIEKN